MTTGSRKRVPQNGGSEHGGSKAARVLVLTPAFSLSLAFKSGLGQVIPSAATLSYSSVKQEPPTG